MFRSRPRTEKRQRSAICLGLFILFSIGFNNSGGMTGAYQAGRMLPSLLCLQ